MWNRCEIDYEAEREGQEFQAKSGVARVVAPHSSSVKFSKALYHLADCDESNFSSKNIVTYSKVCRIAEESAAQIIPVAFAVFINLLDACTFGTVFFPAKFGSNVSGLAIELFLLSTVVVQLVLIRMSSFSCGLGTSMAENIPFVHTMALGIFDSLEHTHTLQQMLPTVLVTVCISTIINGVLFFVVGYFKLGNVLHFFPRHVIMGMTAGFGVFLMSTAVESSTGIIMAEQNLLSFVHALSPSMIYQLLIVLVFEMLLRLTEYFKCSELVVPCMMFFLPLVFYIVLAVSGTSFDEARGNDWLFPETASANWWDTWQLFDFNLVVWEAVALQWSTIFSLAFFTLILVPIRIPSLSMITDDDVNFDEELKAQGVANILSGLMGAVHNYLSYSNSVFFFYVGGRGKWTQLAITAFTLLLFFIGPQIINYVPRLIAGVIMLHLGVDLVVGALISSRKALDSLEYTSVLFIATVVSLLGFVPGICMGVVSACVTFVVQSSRQSSIRAVFSGDTARSNTSWSARQRDKLDIGLALLGGSSIIVVQLQGHLFFGNVQQVVEGIENALIANLTAEDGDTGTVRAADNANSSHSSQLKYLILDCSFVTGADVNAVTGLLKMRDLIASKYNKTLSDTQESSADQAAPVQIRVIFAGLQNSLEVMFSIQETALSTLQAVKLAKEKEKAGAMTFASEEDGILSSPRNVHNGDSDNKGQSTMDRCEEVALMVYHGSAPTAYGSILTNIDSEVSDYDSTRTLDSYSSDGDTRFCPGTALTGGTADQRAGDADDVIARRKKKGRSPSWGSNTSSRAHLVVRGNSACSNNSEGSVNKPQSRSSLRSLRQEAHKNVTQPPATSASLKTPIPVRPSPLKRLFNIASLGKAKSENELCNIKGIELSRLDVEGGGNSTIKPPSLVPVHRSSRLEHHLSPRPLSRMFYSDVNTALQAVEERIIKSTPMPKKRVSSFYVRRTMLGNSALSHSMSAELRREDIVHSPEVTGSSLDDMWMKRPRMPESFSPPPPLALPSAALCPAAWVIGRQGNNTEGPTGSENATLLTQTGALGSPSKHIFSEYISKSNINSSRPTTSRPNSFNRMSTHQESISDSNTDPEKEQDNRAVSDAVSMLEKCREISPENQLSLSLYSALSHLLPQDSTQYKPTAGKDSLSLSPKRSVDPNKKVNSLSELAVPSSVPRHIPSSPLSPNSKQLKIKITNMLFDLSSQWTLGDSSTLKRLARRLRKGVVCVNKRDVLWESGQDAMQMGILLSGRLKAVLRANNDAALHTTRTLQVILPGTIFGELGLLSRGTHSRTIIASADSRLAMLSRDSLDEIEETDKHLALRTAAGRSHELMLFSAGSLGP